MLCGAALFNRSQPRDDRGDSHKQSTSARQAAEALFAPKPQDVAPKPQGVEPSIREAAPASEAVRKPRVLPAASAVPAVHDEPEAPTSSALPKEPLIPAMHVDRIRSWMKYGMTTAQVAEMYGVAAGEVERILRLA
jgi:hypothetical protein